jgi:hypothetical protein
MKFYILCLSLLASNFIFSAHKKNDNDPQDATKLQDAKKHCVQCLKSEPMKLIYTGVVAGVLSCLWTASMDYNHDTSVRNQLNCLESDPYGSCLGRHGYRTGRHNDFEIAARCKKMVCMHEFFCNQCPINYTDQQRQFRDCSNRQFSNAPSPQVPLWAIALGIVMPAQNML